MQDRALLVDECPISDITVDGERWTRVPDVSHFGPQDRVYTVSEDETGGTWVRFGDGAHGQRPPTGSTVVATYGAGPNEVRVTSTAAASSPAPEVDLRLVVRRNAGELAFGQYPGGQAGPGGHAPQGRSRHWLCVLGIALLVALLVLLTSGR